MVSATSVRTEARRSDAPETGAASALHGVMAALAWIPRLVLLHVAWVVLVLAGGVVLGIAPATATLVAALRGDEAVEGAPRPVRAGAGRGTGPSWGRRTCAAGPFLLIALAAAVNVALGVAGALPQWFFPAGFAASAVLGALALLSERPRGGAARAASRGQDPLGVERCARRAVPAARRDGLMGGHALRDSRHRCHHPTHRLAGERRSSDRSDHLVLARAWQSRLDAAQESR